MGYVGTKVTQNIVSTSEITDGTVTGDDLASNIEVNGLDMNGTELILDADADTSITADTDDQIDFKVGGSDKVIINSLGNVGLNNSLYASENTNFKNIHIGQKSSFGSYDAGSTYIVNNAYYNTSSSWIKKVTGASNHINMTTDGDWYFGFSASASAGATTTFTSRYLLNDNGGGVYLYSDGHGNGAITMYNNNIYLAANSGSGEVYATDAAGNHTLLSPHNFQYIPDGASENHAWAYLSEKVTPTTRKDANDKDEVDSDRKDDDSFTYVNVDMMKVVRQVEKLTGTKLIYTGTNGKDDGSTVKDDIIAGLIKRIEALEKA